MQDLDWGNCVADTFDLAKGVAETRAAINTAGLSLDDASFQQFVSDMSAEVKRSLRQTVFTEDDKPSPCSGNRAQASPHPAAFEPVTMKAL